MSEEQEKTQEELYAEAKSMAEARGKEWEEFLEEMKSNGDAPVTYVDLLKVITFMSEDMQGLGQMVNINSQNSQALHKGLQQLAHMIQGGNPQSHQPNKTPGGIILPN